MDDARRIVFLFGSGISKPACMPLGDDITKRVLSGEGAVYNGSESYCFAPGLDPHRPNPDRCPDTHVWRLVAFLRELDCKLRISDHPSACTHTNYEDLYEAASGMDPIHSGVPIEPRWAGLARDLEAPLQPVLGAKDGIHGAWTIAGLARAAHLYIHDFVAYLLTKPAARLDHLDWIADACTDDQFASLDIFTLNHDTVLEDVLASREPGVSLIDGFGVIEDGLHLWTPKVLESASAKIRLFKLHGSVNWFPYGRRLHDGALKQGVAHRPCGWRQDSAGGPGAACLDLDQRHPVLLIGTESKPVRYHNSVFGKLFEHFEGSLSQCNVLIVCGYGFRDPGVNQRLANWLGSPRARMMVVIHKKPEELADAMCALGSRDKIKIVRKWVEEVKWPDLKREIWP